MHLPSWSPATSGTSLQRKLEAAMILKGVVRLKLEGQGEVEVEPRTWYRESGEHFLEARRRDSGEHVRVRVSDIQDVMAY